MTKLFTKPSMSFEKVAIVRLPEDITQWHDSILEHVVTNHEFLSPFLAAGVEWENDSIDEERGTAYGKLYAGRGDQMSWIPVIVKEFALQPVDIFFVGDDGYVLSEENFNTYLPEGNDVGSGMISPKVLERRVTAINKLSSVASVDEARAQRYRETLEERDFAFAARKNGTADKLAEKVDAYEHRKEPEENLKVGTARVFDFLHGGVKLATDYRWGEKVNVGHSRRSKEIEAEVNDKIASGVSCEWEAIGGVMPARAFIAKEATLKQISEPGVYNVKLENGEQAKMFRVPVSVLGENGEIKLSDRMLNVAFGPAVEGGLRYVSDDVLYGKKDSSKHSFEGMVVDLAEAKKDQTGIVVLPTGEGTAILGKVTIIEVRSLPSRRSKISIKCHVNGQQSYHFLINNVLTSPVPVDEHDPLFVKGARNYEIPGGWEFAPLSGAVSLSTTDGPAKLAGATVKLMPDGASYYRFEKTGSDGNVRVDTENEVHAAARLYSLGYTGDVGELLKLAHDKGEIIVSGLRDKPIMGKLAAELPGYSPVLRDRVVRRSRIMQPENLKLASAMLEGLDENMSDSVDTVLDLGLVDDENIQFFVDSIPDFEEVQESLVKLLLKARLGMDEVDPVTIKKAVTYLDATIKDLRDLRRSAIRS